MSFEKSPITAYEDDPILDTVHHPYTAWSQGYDAFLEGYPESLNPYTERLASYWSDGYWTAHDHIWQIESPQQPED